MIDTNTLILIAIVLLAVVVLLVVILRGKLHFTLGNLRDVEVRAGRDPRERGGDAVIRKSTSAEGAALAEGSRAEISQVDVKGNLIARATPPAGPSETPPKSS